MRIFKERLTFGEVLVPSRGWIVAICFLGILGTAQAIHAMILPPDTAETYHLLRWIPEIDWKWYALAILVVTIVFLIENINRAIAKKVKVIGAQYSKALCDTPGADGEYMLGAVAVTPRTNLSHSGGRQCSLQCALEITTTVTIQYYVSRFEAIYEGVNCPILPEALKQGIATPIDSRIISLPFVNNMPWTRTRSWRGAAKYTLHYGLLAGSNRYPYRMDCEVDFDVRAGRSMPNFIVDTRTMYE